MNKISALHYHSSLSYKNANKTLNSRKIYDQINGNGFLFLSSDIEQFIPEKALQRQKNRNSGLVHDILHHSGEGFEGEGLLDKINPVFKQIVFGYNIA